MAKYRKKPVEVEAVQYANRKFSEKPPWLAKALEDGILYYETYDNGVHMTLKVKTLEGDHTATDGDFIIQGVKGELYPCKPDVFEKTYEVVE